jgi:capsular polysaccharide export protein
MPLLCVPPFPGSKVNSFAAGADKLSEDEADALIDQLRALRVGGTYWGAKPPLAPGYALVRVADQGRRSEVLQARAAQPVVCWSDAPVEKPEGTRLVTGCCDPWHLLDGASELIVDGDDNMALIGGIAGVPVSCVGTGAFGSVADASRTAIREALRGHVPATYTDPFSGEQMSASDAADLCGFWRALIDSNRDIAAAVGFAFWKRETVAPLLWSGAGVPFRTGARSIGSEDRVAIWRARTSPGVLRELERAGAELIEVEDGFIRSAGLGADCVPPLSIVVDRIGAHFDPSGPNELENLLQNGSFTATLVGRASALRELIVRSGVSKYDAGGEPLQRRAPDQRHILVPGQVEDDRAVLAGGQGLTSNLELLRRVRADAPDAFILYKPHPDVEAGHRTGRVPDDMALTCADEVVRDTPVSALIDMVDELHVNSSLAGFEALLRDKPVTTHGVPFYAGWGLTRDLGRVPERRTARRTIDELVAAVLLLYPRYLDPVTGLPCPAEILIHRLSQRTGAAQDGVVVRLRRLQGRMKSRLTHLVALR